MGAEYDLDIPPPPPQAHAGSFLGRIRALPPGGSFFAQGKIPADAQNAASLLRRQGRIAFYVQTQTVTEKGVEGIRVWRVEKKVRG